MLKAPLVTTIALSFVLPGLAAAQAVCPAAEHTAGGDQGYVARDRSGEELTSPSQTPPDGAITFCEGMLNQDIRRPPAQARLVYFVDAAAPLKNDTDGLLLKWTAPATEAGVEVRVTSAREPLYRMDAEMESGTSELRWRPRVAASRRIPPSDLWMKAWYRSEGRDIYVALAGDGSSPTAGSTLRAAVSVNRRVSAARVVVQPPNGGEGIVLRAPKSEFGVREPIVFELPALACGIHDVSFKASEKRGTQVGDPVTLTFLYSYGSPCP